MSVCPTCGTPAIDRNNANRRVFALLNNLGIGDNERRELAMMLPTQTGASQPPSFATLTAAELQLLGDWLTGLEKGLELAELRVERGRGD